MKPRRPEAGYSLLGLMVGITLTMILMAVAMPTWKYIVKNEREEELITRLKQIQRAVERYQKRHGAPPVSFEALVQQRFLRRPYKDPMTQSGKWRLVRPGEPCGGGGGILGALPGGLGLPGATQPSPGAVPQSSTAQPQAGAGLSGTAPAGQGIGGIIAVRTTNNEKGLRLVNGQSRYDQWCVQPGQELVIGKAVAVLPRGGLPGAPKQPGAATPLPRPTQQPQ